LKLVAPILGTSYKIYDRLSLAEQLKIGVPVYRPTEATANYLQTAPMHEVAQLLPNLILPKARLDSFDGDISECI
jgi:hypothetical protein